MDTIRRSAAEGLYVGGFAAALHLIGIDAMVSSTINSTVGNFLPPGFVGAAIIGGTVCFTVISYRVAERYMAK